MTLGERIKKARRSLELTQQKFADQIGTTQNNIASYETGRREPSAAAINNICKTFNINETWLRTGEGEMFRPASSGTLGAFIQERGLTQVDRILIEKFSTLDASSRRAVVDYVLSVADAILSDSAAPSAFAPAPIEQTRAEKSRKEWTDAELHAELDRQLAEQREAAENPPVFWRGRSETA